MHGFGILLYSNVFLLLSNHTLLSFVTSDWCSMESNMQLIWAAVSFSGCGWYASLPKDLLHVVLGFWHWLLKTPWPWTPSAYRSETLILISLRGTVGHVSSPLKTVGRVIFQRRERMCCYEHKAPPRERHWSPRWPKPTEIFYFFN